MKKGKLVPMLAGFDSIRPHTFGLSPRFFHQIASLFLPKYSFLNYTLVMLDPEDS